MSNLDISVSVGGLTNRKHLPFLDGIRGLAATYVVAMHSVGLASNFQSPPGRSHYILQPLLYGQIAVSVFIVLSGYCLASPYLRNGSLVPMDRASFCRKRAWRILPPYYGALILSMIVDWLVAHRAIGPDNLGTGSIVSHLFLVHDFKEGWYKAINSPMWSVAVEWHIYFVFAFVLFPIWYRFGILLSALAALMFGVIPHFAFGKTNFDWAHPWYLFSFAIGMLAAVVTETNQPARLAILCRSWNALLLLCVCLLIIAVYAVKIKLGNHLFLVTDTLEGLVAALIIIRFGHERQTSRRSLLRSLFESRIALGIGAMSYSLYLFHWPVLYVLDVLVGQQIRPEPRCWFLLLVGLPISLLVAFGSYLVIERPLISKRHWIKPVYPSAGLVTSPDQSGLLVQP